MLAHFVSLLMTASTVYEPVVARQLTSPETGALRLELGTLSPPLQGNFAESVRAWALAQRSRYGLPVTSTLRTGDIFATRLGASFHLLQTVKDVEVYGAKLVVSLDGKGQVVQVASSLETYEKLVDTYTFGPDEALKRAAGPIPLPSLRADGVPHGNVKKAFFRVGEDLHAGYLTHVQSLDAMKNWYVAVDAVTGERIFVQNRVHQAASSLEAAVYPVSPGGLDAGIGKTPTISVELTHPDGSSMVGTECTELQADGGLLVTPNDGGFLCGTQLMSMNCCPTEGCVPDAGPKRIRAKTVIRSIPIDLDVAVCDRAPRASNVTNPTKNYVFAPVDPPVDPKNVLGSDLANSDDFAEVHAFYHVNRVYDWLRKLSAKGPSIFNGQPGVKAFSMRDERRTPAMRPAVWANAIFPNTSELSGANLACIFNPPCKINTLQRVDNAAFFPRENFAQLPLPGFDTGVDTLLIFQGNLADAAYDATVIQHEFGHGVVYSTAALTFDDLAIDSRSANNEGGALHEGFSDYIAAAFNNLSEVGPYFGPRIMQGQQLPPGVSTDAYLRTMNNAFTCPSALWGEVHQDAQHVAGALWDGRKHFMNGDSTGETYDATFYAMLVSLSPNADFAMTVEVMTDMVKRAFPQATDAEAKMKKFFEDRGVVGCSKVLEVTNTTAPRIYYGVAASTALKGATIPGPFQFKLAAPKGATKVSVTGRTGSGGAGGGTAPAAQILARVGTPITFKRDGVTLTNDAEKTGALTAGKGSVDIAVPCGQDVYVTIGAAQATQLQQLQVQIDEAASCEGPDAGQPVLDAGTTVVDAGTGTPDGNGNNGEVDAGVTAPNPKPPSCGCSTPADLAPAAFGLLFLLRLRRRSQG
jgi:hypothetical protein